MAVDRRKRSRLVALTRSETMFSEFSEAECCGIRTLGRRVHMQFPGFRTTKKIASKVGITMFFWQ